MSSLEQTLSIIKPDAVERNLENEIKNIFLGSGFKIIKDKKIQISKVVMDIEPTTQLVNCHKPQCPLLPGCGLIPLLEQARSSFFEVLSFHTLADLIKKPKALKHLIKLLPTAVNE